MKKNIQKLLRHELIKGSALVFVGGIFSNFFNYIFHLITGRMLGPEKYAIIASLISLVYVISFPSAIINTIVTRKVAALSAKKDIAGIKGVFKFILKNVFYFNLLIIFIFFVFQKNIADFLKIDDSFLVFLLGVSFAVSLFSIISLATLQGLLKFLGLSVINAFSSFLRDLLAFLAIIFNFGVLGVVWGMTLAGIIAFLSSLFPLRFIFKANERVKKFRFKSYLSMIWVAAGLLGIGLMLNGDVILVKHFFNSYQAGLYSALSTMGKIVFFASSSIVVVFLPLATKKKESGSSAVKELFLSQILVFLMSIGVIFIFFAFPKLTINIFYGKNYFSVAPYLGLMGIYFLFYNLSYLFISFFIALKRKKILVSPLIYSILQISLIFLFHKSFYQIILVLITTSSLLFLHLLVYFLRYEKIRL